MKHTDRSVCDIRENLKLHENTAGIGAKRNEIDADYAVFQIELSQNEIHSRRQKYKNKSCSRSHPSK